MSGSLRFAAAKLHLVTYTSPRREVTAPGCDWAISQLVITMIATVIEWQNNRG